MKKILVSSALAFATLAFLGMSQLSAGDGTKCGAGKCGDSPKVMKCGSGKCGNTTKPKVGKCGSGKCGASEKPVKPAPKSTGKCGVGKCG